MKLKRGCGCLLGILGLVNLVFLVSALIALASSRMSKLAAASLALLFLANLVACAILTIAALRGMPIGGQVGEEEEELPAEVGDDGPTQEEDL